MTTVSSVCSTHMSALHSHQQHQQYEQSSEKRRVSISDRCGDQRRPLPSPPLMPYHSNKNSKSSSSQKKSVRFCSDDDLEQVRLFIETQIPLAVRSDPPTTFSSSSNEQTVRYDLKYPSWPSRWATYKSLKSEHIMIRMENIQLAYPHQDDKNNHSKVLLGKCRVSNVAYEKQVTVRHSFDYWKTYQEIDASFHESITTAAAKKKEWDMFTFDIGVPSSLIPLLSSCKGQQHIGPITCWIALRYKVSGQEFWDNNDGKNYQVEIIPATDESHSSNINSGSTIQPQLGNDDTDSNERRIDVLSPDPFLVKPTSKKVAPTSSSLHNMSQLKSRYSFSLSSSTATSISHHPFSTWFPPTHIPVQGGGYNEFISKYCFHRSSSSPASILQT